MNGQRNEHLLRTWKFSCDEVEFGNVGHLRFVSESDWFHVLVNIDFTFVCTIEEIIAASLQVQLVFQSSVVKIFDTALHHLGDLGVCVPCLSVVSEDVVFQAITVEAVSYTSECDVSDT